MKASITFCVFFLSAIYSFSQNTFQKVLGTGGNDGVSRLGQCNDGGYYLMGWKDQQILYGTFLAKTDSAGNLLWQKEFYIDSASLVLEGGTLLSDGNYVMICRNYSTLFQVKLNAVGDTISCKSLYFISTAERILALPGGEYAVAGTVYDNLYGIYQGVVLKVDINGNIISRCIFNMNYDEPFPYSMKMLPNGYIAVAGFYTEHISTHPLESFLFIIDPQFNLVRVKIFKAPVDIMISAMEVLNDGTILLAGSGSSMGTNFILRSDTSGTILWSREFSPYTFINEIEQTGDSNFLFLFNIYSPIGAHQVSLVKTDYFANVLWENTYVSQYSGASYPLSTSDNGIAISVQLDTISNLFGNNDAVIIKTDSMGNSGCAQVHTPYQAGSASVVYSVDTTINFSVDNSLVVSYFYNNLKSVTGDLNPGILCSSLGVNDGNGSESFDIRIFPNPATEFVSINTASFEESELFLEIKDLMGRTVIHKKVPIGNKVDVDVSNLTKGIYVVILSGKKTMEKKVFCKQ